MRKEHNHVSCDQVDSELPSPSWNPVVPPVQSDHYTQEFLAIVSAQMADFLKLIPLIARVEGDGPTYSKRFYDYANSQARFAEMLLDSCGTKENRAWFFLRELVAMIRCVSSVAFQLRYIEVRVQSFDMLQDNIQEFLAVTARVRTAFDWLLQHAFAQCADEAQTLGITLPSVAIAAEQFPLFQSPGKLHADLHDEQEPQKRNEAIIKIVTSFLEIVEEYTFLKCNRVFSHQELVEMVPERVNEERLRTFEAAVHNLQAVYDTHIQYTTLEANDNRLLRLRGCISMALHLLEIATELIHFHERHERNSRHAAIYQRLQAIVGTYQILEVMGNYALFYCTQFLQNGKKLSEEVVRDYAQIISKRIPIPIYRGFHVRPSTYISKIVRHYGARVRMYLGNEEYDAESVFDLFRANEEINMEKRRLAAKKLLSFQGITAIPHGILPQVLKRTLHELAEQKVLVIHQEILPEDLDIKCAETDELTAEEVRGAINQVLARVLAMEKIDILMPVSVTFIGDRRSLEDIELLAHSGYGEDARGNNMPLPREIAYLYK